MLIVVYVIAGYFCIGILSIAVLDVLTKRVRKHLSGATFETQERLNAVGETTGRKTAVILTIGALILFWPVAIYGALTPDKEKN